MKILFICMGVESLGVEYLAASARAAGHEADIAFDPAVFGGHLMWDVPSLSRMFDLRTKIIERAVRERPDVAAFSCVSANFQWALSIAAELKKRAPEIRTVFGGPHVSAVPERVIAEPSVDALIVGEADTAFPSLLTDWESGADGRRPGVWEKRGGEIIRWEGPPPLAHMDTLPFPAKDVYYDRVPVFERQYSIMTMRGCPYRCTYCYKSETASGAKSVRRRRVDNVIEELEKTVKRGVARMIVFRDDVFTIQKEWLNEFAASYCKKIRIPYFCYTHPALLDETKAELLRDSGCAYVTMGVQSVDEGQRRDVLKRYYTNDQVRGAAALLKNKGITVSVDHILGFPGDTPEIMRNAVVFYNELRPDRLLTYRLTYFPGTEIVEMAREMNILTDADLKSIESGEMGNLYGRRGVSRQRTVLGRFIVLFSLIPILPPGLIRFLLRKNRYRFLPRSTVLINLLLAVNAFRTKDPFFFQNLRYFVSRKQGVDPVRSRNRGGV